MIFMAARNFDGDQVPEPELAISRSIAARVFETGKSILSVNAGDDQRFEGVAIDQQPRAALGPASCR
jgi:hypothetical protein